MITCDPGTQLVVIMCCRYQIYWQGIEIKSCALRLSNPAASCLWSGEKKTRKDSTTVTVRYYSESFFLFSVLSPSLPKKKTNVGEMSSQNSSLITPYASSSCNNRLLQIADIKALEEENTNTKTNKQASSVQRDCQRECYTLPSQSVTLCLQWIKTDEIFIKN